MSAPLLTLTDAGLYCPDGDFFIDPWQPVSRAVITHAHADHARPGSASYLSAQDGVSVLRHRLGPYAQIDALPYGDTQQIIGVRLSLHPAGHILGSAQVRVERGGEVWVVSGDYKTAPDPTCRPFEPIRCHTFVTESTFGLPIYRWPAEQEIFEQIHAFWRENQEVGLATVIFAYSLGKAQRILAGLDTSIGPIYCHGAVDSMNQRYRETGISLPPTTLVTEETHKDAFCRALILAPPSAQRSPWTRRLGDYAGGFVSGWMLIRGARRRRVVERGFVLSDHADWPGLLSSIEATGAQRVLVTHGHIVPMVQWLREKGLEAHGLQTRFEGELDEVSEESESKTNV
ncbi:MAG: ligase-associated DNA damage response exonuclease [Planctomycetes bacterium]|nr:ligase-associated DNA damage response exonuclease [Planctomycetota bacterium]